MPLKKDYASPRWSQEILDCSMPMTFDTYSRCSYNCFYCQPAGSLIWMGDGSFKPIEEVRPGDMVIGFEKCESRRKFAYSKVEEVFTRKADVVKLTLESGSKVFCTPDHHWFTGRPEPQFEYMPPKVGRPLRKAVEPWLPEVSEEYMRGYIHGIVEGDGSITNKVYRYPGGKRKVLPVRNVRLAMNDEQPLKRFFEYATHFDLNPFNGIHSDGLPLVRIYGKKAIRFFSVEAQHGPKEYWRGWLAGIFDAEGSLHDCLRIYQYREVNPVTYSKIKYSLDLFGFDYVEEPHSIRLKGGLKEITRFHGLTQGTLWRKIEKAVIGREVNSERDNVVKIEPVTNCNVYALKTTTHNYVAQGYLSRNCFSFFQKAHCCSGYNEGKVRSVNPDKIKFLFTNILKGNYSALSPSQKQFIPYVRNRNVMQWGALADQFDQYEKRHGISLELLKFFDEIDYPLSMSSKAAWYTEDERYMSLIRRHRHNWHFKVSIITGNRFKAAKVERGVPSPEARLKAIERLSNAGIHVTLRLRPYIIGISDDWRQLIHAAHEAGADSVSTEFFCMESRADERLRERYRRISEIAGYDIYTFYKGNSPQNGYKRLSESIKRPILTSMRDLTHSLGMRFHVSDAYCRDLNDATNCCGVPPEWKCATSHFGGAILRAKASGEVRYSDIKDEIDRLFGGFLWYKAAQYNTTSNRKAAIMKYATMADYFRICWNKPQSCSSPRRMYGKLLKPVGKDKNGDIVYRYIGPK